MHYGSSSTFVDRRDPARRLVHRRLRLLLGRDYDRSGAGAESEIAADSEAAAQAASGLMAVHGRECGRPRRLGLDVATIATTIVASQGAIAAALSALRGLNVRYVRTTLVAGALSFLHHHLALATCGNGLPFRDAAVGEGPPFRTRDGHLIEIEALQGDEWTQFWDRLGVAANVAGECWLAFVFRFLTARCALPAELHEAIARHDAHQIDAAAAATRISVCRVRSYDELVQEAPQPDYARIRSARRFSHRVRRASGDDPRSSLAGVRVIEVTSRLQGPLAALLLQQLGAEVLKVEPPGGDFGRRGYPRAGEVGAAYLAYNHSKDRIELDYKLRSDRERLVELIRGADVFLHNWPPGRAEALGLDARTLARVNPALIYAHASGWARGAAPCTIASDYLIQAHAALGDGLYPAGEPARPSRLTLIDALGGLLACEGVLAALYRRATSERGQRVESTLYSGAMALQRRALAAFRYANGQGRANGRQSWHLLDQPVRASDDYVFIGPLTDRTRTALAAACGLPRHTLAQSIIDRVAGMPVTECLARLKAAGVPAVAVCSDLRMLPESDVAAPWLERVENACWVPGPPWRFSL